MNPGFLSFILVCISIILLASGWKQTLVGDVSDKAVVSIFAVWLAIGLLRIVQVDSTIIDGAVLITLVTIVLVALIRRPPLGVLHFISLGLFLASVYYLFVHLNEMNPFFLPHRSWSSASLLVAVASAMLVRKTQDQTAVISLALLFGTGLYMRMHQERSGVSFGGLRFQDEWWFALVTARLLSLAGENAVVAARGASRSILDRWKGLKK